MILEQTKLDFIIRNTLYGFCEMADGFLRVISLGHYCPNFAFSWICWWDKRALQKELDAKRLKESKDA
jgi:hypothetical protein